MNTHGYILVNGVRVNVVINEELHTAIVNYGEGKIALAPVDADGRIYIDGKRYIVYENK